MTDEETPQPRRTKKYLKELQREYFKTLSTMMLSGFSLVAALAWNEVIKDAIDRFVGQGNTFFSLLIYALAVTAVAVIVSYWLGAVAKRLADETNDTKE